MALIAWRASGTSGSGLPVSASARCSSASSASECPEGGGTLNAEGSSAQKNAIEEAIASFQEACEGTTVNYNPTEAISTATSLGAQYFSKTEEFFGITGNGFAERDITPEAGPCRCRGDTRIGRQPYRPRRTR